MREGDARAAFVFTFRNAEIEDLDQRPVPGATTANEEVRRLEVAVHDSEPVGLDHRLGDLEHDVDRLLHRHRPARVKRRIEIEPFEVLHHDVGKAVRKGLHVHDAGGVDGPQLRCGARFALETLQNLGEVRNVGPQHFEREALSQAQMQGLVDDGHTALAECAHHFVLARDRVAGLG